MVYLLIDNTQYGHAGGVIMIFNPDVTLPIYHIRKMILIEAPCYPTMIKIMFETNVFDHTFIKCLTVVLDLKTILKNSKIAWHV